MRLLDHLRALLREPSRGDFNPRIAYILSRFARESYKDSDEINLDKLSGSIGQVSAATDCSTFRLEKFIREKDPFKDVELFVARNGYNEIVVAFRGTETGETGTIRDIITDLQAVFKKRYSRRPGSARRPNRVHRGFLNAYLRIEDELTEVLRDLVGQSEEPPPQIFYTGHSLGGGLATVAAMDIAVRQDDDTFPSVPIVLYSFGAPRTLNYNCQQGVFNKLLKNTYAVANDNDRIPGLPPVIQTTRLRYSHIDDVVLLEPDGSFALKAGDSYRGEAITGPVGGHRIAEYQDRLEKTSS